MSKLIAFGTGMVAGAVALTAAVTSVPPVRRQAAKLIASLIMYGIEHNPEARKEAVKYAKHIIEDYEEK